MVFALRRTRAPVGSTLVHIALAPQVARTGSWQRAAHHARRIRFPGFIRKIMAEEQTPRDKKQIVALLQADGERFAKWLDSLSDDFLGESVAIRRHDAFE